MALPKPLRQVLALVYGAYLLISITAGLFGVLIPCYFLLRPISEGLYLRVSAHIQGSYLVLFPFVLQTLLGIKIRLTGVLPPKEPVLVLSNHLSHEWTVMYCLGHFTGVLGLVRTIIKDVIKYVPGFGWGMWVLYWPFVSRDFAKDAPVLKAFGEAYTRAKLPVQLWLYPEGTRQTPKKLAESQQYAKEKGYPVWNHIMLPRHRGFAVTASALKGLVHTILNVTVQYDGWKGRAPGLMDLFGSDPSKPHVIHAHISSHAMATLPEDEEGKRVWLMDSFATKDRLLTDFAVNKRFPGTEIKTTPSTLGMLAHVVAWAVLTYVFWSSLFRFVF